MNLNIVAVYYKLFDAQAAISLDETKAYSSSDGRLYLPLAYYF